ncbi:MAG: DinB family protein [Burkholderiales bacterium]|nr:DinB family protein [Burkholderiales bacterium]
MERGAGVIGPGYVSMMARYNRWQNESIYNASETLADEARRQDLGAFFGSIHATLSHLAWGDATWMSRFTDRPAPGGRIAESTSLHSVWEELKAERRALDADILAWADRVDDGWLASELSWYSGAAGRQVTRPAAALVVHFFNHQTHHRGQVHAMLTRCGARPGDTDLFLMEP